MIVNYNKKKEIERKFRKDQYEKLVFSPRKKNTHTTLVV
tara:strand:- start:602 stop:718 length:117 start_codon:yes stop_codon:yes gene_type:complete